VQHADYFDPVFRDRVKDQVAFEVFDPPHAHVSKALVGEPTLFARQWEAGELFDRTLDRDEESQAFIEIVLGNIN
jgi:hypothetical protein